MPSFADLSLSTNVAIFTVGAAIIWMAGTRISRYADRISKRTGAGQVVLGVLLLGGVTSLPELAVSVSAAWQDNPDLAVNNVLGGVAMQVAILAIADFAIKNRALTSVNSDPKVIIQGAFGTILLGIAAAAVIIGDVAVLGIGVGSWLILIVTMYAITELARNPNRAAWLASNRNAGGANRDDDTREAGMAARANPARDKEGSEQEREAFGWLIAKTSLAAVAIIIAGYAVSSSAEIIADETGLGQSFFGAVLVAISTSLPELSTVLSAVRLGLYSMAMADIFGTNIFDILFIFAVDFVSGGDAVLSRVGDFSAFAAILGIVVTGLYIVGLTERRDRTFFRLGIDSLSVTAAYIGGVALLYTMR